MSSSHPNFKFTQIITPSVTPVYENNPGYTWFEFSNVNRIESFVLRQMQLAAYQNSNGTIDVPEFITVDPQSEFSVDFNDPDSIRFYTYLLTLDLEMFANYTSISNGMGPTNSTDGVSHTDQICITCMMSYLDKPGILSDKHCVKHCNFEE